MAYNGFYGNYQPYIPYQNQAPATPQPQNNGINWVQGEAGAKSFLVLPGQSVLLMDSESSSFYIKPCDPSGMPRPLRVFDYTERTQAPEQTTAQYVTRDELEARLAELTKEKENAESLV